MDIAELIEIALANSDERRVEVAALEPADIRKEGVSGLAQILSELVENAIAFSEPGDQVRVTGLHEHGHYLISISDRGPGLPAHLIAELNRVLGDPDAAAGADPKLGIALVARLAARQNIEVQLVPGAPGTTARVTVPGRLVSRPDPDRPPHNAAAGHRLPPRSPLLDGDIPFDDHTDETIDLTRFERGYQMGSGVVAMTEEARREAEAFLQKVFAPLVERPGLTERPAPRSPNSNGPVARPPAPQPTPEAPKEQDSGATVTTLRKRVPGENFSLIEDDASTMAAERAIDIRTALSRYAEGRRTARDTEDY